ncbi:unnamed protein product [Fusarium graminearum]|nr:hypothetical protein HG531_004017 [Fusarium graminearum]CAF3430783.1 unnamed protein product [Fusarium graminearum]
MLARTVLLIAFACNAMASPFVVTNPKDLKNDWHSYNYTTTRGENEKIHWKFALEGHNAVPDPGDFSIICQGVQNGTRCGEHCLQASAFAPCKDRTYEARQWFNGPETVIEVCRTTLPDLGKKVITTGTANITAQTEVGTVHYHIKFGDFQKQFISTFNPPPSA